ncbi:type II secretion system protein J [Komagataeibacter sp. FNDCR2]|uniref:PulJ/GspJ family protein n=1 Tax=Komagataeibacter sp. FNDCR2 TaxID=2878682 RepID=UPI001E45C7D0|nr:type II secretion system protein [Komagataeibacter sp. FNDCR2]MCE2574224.1 type II secretion system GspH family protein [Komagataeibacter sp. FNDCR2]
MTARRRDSGFTLLEVMVAFAIAGLSLTAVWQSGVDGWRATRVAERSMEALSRAQSHLAVVGHGLAIRPLSQGEEDGGGFYWQLRITPTQSNGRMTLYAIEITESWSATAGEGKDDDAPDRRALTLRTARIGATAGPAP